MSKQFSADSDEKVEIKGTKGKTQAQLLVLLLLVAVGAYLYFFTGIIKPREEAPAPQPAQTAQVKQPMPPRPAPQKPGQQGVQPQPAAPASAPTPTTAPAPAPAAKQAPAPASSQSADAPKAAPQAPAKPEQPKAAKKETPAVQKTAGKQLLPPTDQKKIAAPVKPAEKGAVAGAKQVAAVTKPALSSPGKQEPPQHKQPAGAFTLKTIDMVFAKDAGAAEAKLKKIGVKPVVRHTSHKLEPMNRLFYAEYPDRQSAGIELDQLHAKLPDAFIIQENGKYSIYAGSYIKEGRAAVEQDRLFEKGIRLVMKKTQVKIPVTYLTAGSFSSPEEARNTAARLKKVGVTVAVVNAGKKMGKK